MKNSSNSYRERVIGQIHNASNYQTLEILRSVSNNDIFHSSTLHCDRSVQRYQREDCKRNSPEAAHINSAIKDYFMNDLSRNHARSECMQSVNETICINKFIHKYLSNYHKTRNLKSVMCSREEIGGKRCRSNSGIGLCRDNNLYEDRNYKSERVYQVSAMDNRDLNCGFLKRDERGSHLMEAGENSEKRGGKDDQGEKMERMKVNGNTDDVKKIDVDVKNRENNYNKVDDIENGDDEKTDNNYDNLEGVEREMKNEIGKTIVCVKKMSKKFTCQYCNYKGKLLVHFKRHMARHENELSCKVHGSIFQSTPHLTEHFPAQSDAKPFQCLVCQCAFKQVTTLHQHMLAHTNVEHASWDLHSLICNTMEKNPGSIGVLTSSEDLSTYCQCNSRCRHKAESQQRVQGHTREQPFHCTQCSITCWSKDDLKRHLLIHTNLKTFSCDFCDFKCLKELVLNRHLLTHTHVDLYTCSLCEFTCKSKSVLIKHTVSHINDDDVEEISQSDAAKEAMKIKQLDGKHKNTRPRNTKRPDVRLTLKHLHKTTAKTEQTSKQIQNKLPKMKQITKKGILVHHFLDPVNSEQKGQSLDKESISEEQWGLGLRRSVRHHKTTSKLNYCETDSLRFFDGEKHNSVSNGTVGSEDRDNNGCGSDSNHSKNGASVEGSHVNKELGSTGHGFDPIEEALLEGKIPNANMKSEKSRENCRTLQGMESSIDSYFFQSENNFYYCRHCQYSCETVAYLKRHMKVHTDLEFEFCPHCEYFCKTDDQLKEHMVKHSKEGADDRPFPCGQCEFRSRTQGDLKRHLLTHLEVKPFACTMCSYTCARKTRLEEHWRIHSNVKPFSCNICRYKCRSRQNLNSHLKRHSHRKQHSCPYCEFKSLTRPLLKRHMQQDHTDKRPYACDLCSFRSWLSTDLKKHEWIHAGVKPFECDQCDYKCRRISRLREHVMVHKASKPFRCKKFSQAGSTEHFKKHMEGHQKKDVDLHVFHKSKSLKITPELTKTARKLLSLRKTVKISGDGVESPANGPNEKMSVSDSSTKVVASIGETDDSLLIHFENESVAASESSASQERSSSLVVPSTLFPRRKYVRGQKRFSCTICTYVCKKLSHLKRHMFCHTTERPYKCGKCEYTSKTEDNLRRHIKRHTGIKPYSCKLCIYRCYELGDLNQHLLTHTDFKAYKCTLCDYAARKRYHLNEHMMTHSNIRPFLCSECGDSFRTNSKLREHTFKHTREKNIPCPHCKFTCRRDSELNKHLKKHTEPKPEKETKYPKPKEPKPFLCPECGFSFKYNSALKQHMVTHTDEKPWPCPHCAFHCRTKGQLKSHVTKHLETKPLSCEYCPFTCKHESSLRRHRLIHTCKEPLRCQFCEFTCVRNYDIKRHIQNKHKIEISNISINYPSKQDSHSNVLMDNTGKKSSNGSSNRLEFLDNQVEYVSDKPSDYANTLMELSSEKSLAYASEKTVDNTTDKLMNYALGKSLEGRGSKPVNCKSLVDSITGKSIGHSSVKLINYTASKSFDYPAGKMMDCSLKQMDYVNRHIDYPGRLLEFTGRPLEFMDEPINVAGKPMDYTSQHTDYTLKNI